MGFGFKQPLVGEKRCVTTQVTAAGETTVRGKYQKISEKLQRMLDSLVSSRRYFHIYIIRNISFTDSILHCYAKL